MVNPKITGTKSFMALVSARALSANFAFKIHAKTQKINAPMMAVFLYGPFEEELTALLEEEPDW